MSNQVPARPSPSRSPDSTWRREPPPGEACRRCPDSTGSPARVAGSGADAAPYFRIFNPQLQAKRFDPDGHYVRAWAPELLADEPPEMIVDLGATRQAALDAYEHVKRAARS